ncbi:MAG: hypothetical protein K0R99_886 [Microbacterium sp.]|uniref:hypothetical protein n=1 Tax=Microbacterium sp. TaxID=51671 RepID=UPI00263391EA|nr:hypothetical protein [Microbacterium sp.]MDF2559440.1 hypothetical protein [Microbacterium sp.]
MTEEIQKNKGISRRTIVKGAAWSVPVIAAAVATPLAAASVVSDDLVPALSGPIGLSLTALGLPVATINTVNTLTITNNGTDASPAGATAVVQYNPGLLTLNIAAVGGISVGGTDGNFTITLPAIAPGDTLTIGLGTTLDSLLNVGLLTSLLGGPQQVMTATVTGDSVTGNNATSENVGITIL